MVTNNDLPTHRQLTTEQLSALEAALVNIRTYESHLFVPLGASDGADGSQ